MKYTDFTNLFSLQKTLRFELIPQGPTEEKIKKLQEEGGLGLLQRDQNRAENYKKAKKIIDVFHRHQIEEGLALIDFAALECINDLEYIGNNLHKTEFLDEKEKEKASDNLSKAQENLRKAIASVLTGSARKGSAKQNTAYKKLADRFKLLNGKELFDPAKNNEFLKVSQEAGHSETEFRDTIGYFKGFTTYFSGFNENRKNMYSDGAEVTAIGNRIVHENLPRYLDNILVFEKIRSQLPASDLKDVRSDLGLKKEISFFFKIENFQNFLNQSGIDMYNMALGGFFLEDSKEKKQGLNEKINLYNQKHPEARLPFLKPLYKQILSETKELSFRPEPFETDREMLAAIEDFWENNIRNAENPYYRTKFNLLNTFQNSTKKFKSMKDDELKGVFVDAKRLSNLSHQALGEWDILKTALRAKFLDAHNDESSTALERGVTSHLAKPYYSIAELDAALDLYFQQVESSDNPRNRKSLRDFFNSGLFVESVLLPNDGKSGNISNESDETVEVEKDIMTTIHEKYRAISPLLKDKANGNDSLHQDKDKVGKIKEFLESLKTLQRHLSFLHTEGNDGEKNGDFYVLWDSCYAAIQSLNPLYNKVRNRLTRKPFSQEKLKLNFDSSTLLAGWDLNKETTNLSIILKKDGLYYLGIMDKQNNHLFEGIPEAKSNNTYRKLNYKLLPGPNKMLPKVFFSEKGRETYKPANHILDLYKKGTFKQGETFKLNDLHKLIDFYKDAINRNSDWSVFQFKFRPTKDYSNISQFYSEVEAQGYKVWFSRIDATLIEQWLSEGKLYLFKIYNKDFSQHSKGKPNLHTVYWWNLFEPVNLSNVVYKLNGEAEIFFRSASIRYTEKERREGHHVKALKGKFEYPILKDRRYSLDKFLFHVPITINFQSKKLENINSSAHLYIKETKATKIIGIDRGERHLLYLSLIDEKGNILNQFSLNTIRNDRAQTDIDFRAKLHVKEKDRQDARKNWDVIENIKELKEGYLSLVVHQIAKLMVENQAILVMEDLNFGFKRGRFKVEKQVYQKFEKMLIDKLNYLVFKEIPPKDPGGSLNAFQFTSKFDSFQKLGRQSGMIFYVPAAYTSKIDPVTGFYNFLNPKALTVRANQEFFQKFDSICYNSENGYFEFQATYGNFVHSAENRSKRKKSKKTDPYIAELARKEWIICSHVAERYRFRRSKNGSISYEPFNCNEELKSLLEKEEIDFEDGHDVKDKIASSQNSTFLKGMIEILRVLLAMRYNNGKNGDEEKDYIVSPVLGPKDVFFNSLGAGESLPKDADANGAYNIARKGLLLVKKIREFNEQGKNKYPDLFITQHEWLYSLWVK